MPNWWFLRIMEDFGIGGVIAWSFWAIGSVVLHELAHGWTAIRAGDRTPIHTGHMTWNPVVHMGISGVIMFVLLGVTWGFMPIDPTRFRGKYDEARVAFAGPMTNIVLGLICVVGAGILAGLDLRGTISLSPGTPLDNLRMFFFMGALLNFVLAPLNLLPIPPLDGSRILANFVPAFRSFVSGAQAQGVSLVLMLLLFMFGGKYFMTFSAQITGFLAKHVAKLVA